MFSPGTEVCLVSEIAGIADSTLIIPSTQAWSHWDEGESWLRCCDGLSDVAEFLAICCTRGHNFDLADVRNLFGPNAMGSFRRFEFDPQDGIEPVCADIAEWLDGNVRLLPPPYSGLLTIGSAFPLDLASLDLLYCKIASSLPVDGWIRGPLIGPEVGRNGCTVSVLVISQSGSSTA